MLLKDVYCPSTLLNYQFILIISNYISESMVDNRYATALVIGSVLSLLATVYLSVAVGTQHWYQYRIRPAPSNNAANTSELVKDFINGDFNEKNYSETMFRLNGTLGLWWRCIMVPSETHWYKEPSMWSFSFVPFFLVL